MKTLAMPRLNTIVLIGFLSTMAFATIQGIYAVYILKEYTRPIVQQEIRRDPNGAILRARALTGAETTSAPVGGEGGSMLPDDVGDVTTPYAAQYGGDYTGPQNVAPPADLSWRHVEKLLVRPESARVVGNIFGVIGLLSLFIQGGLMRTLPKRVGEGPLVLSGTFIMAIGLLCVAFASYILPHVVWGQYLACAVLTLGNGLATPVLTSLVSQFSPEAERGEVMGVFQSTQSLGRILGPNIGGLAFSYITAGAPFVLGAIVMLVAAALALQLRGFVSGPKSAPNAA